MTGPRLAGRPRGTRLRGASFASVALAAAGAFAPVRAVQQAPGTVAGQIRSAGTGDPIAGATVRIRRGLGFRYLVTDAEGWYRGEHIAPGEAWIQASAIDHAPLEAGVRVPEGSEVRLDLELALRPVRLPALLMEVEASRLRLEPPALARGGFRDEGETELRALEASPGVAELGLGAGLGSDPNDPGNVLYVRGAAADLKLVLLDGAPVYAPFHLSGLMDAFPDGVLERARLYIGGTPARYDGGLSYVLDLDLRPGDGERFHTAGAVDVLGATARVEGPLWDRARVLLSGRRLHGLGYPAITGEDDLPYGYDDALGRLDLDLGAGRFSATGFWNRESVELDIGKLEAGEAPESAYWGNTAGSLRYSTPLGRGDLHVTAAIGRFRTRIPILLDPGAEPVAFTTARGRNQRTRTEAWYERPGETVRWSFGGGVDTDETALDQRTLFGGTTSSTLGRATALAAWGQGEWTVAPEVEIHAGLRAEYFEPAGTFRLAPRVAALWHVAERATLTISAGRFNQLVRGPESILSSDLTGPTLGSSRPFLDTPGPLGEGPFQSVAGANHLVVGLENEFEHGIEVGLEGYFKDFDGVVGAEQLFSSGADLWVQARNGPVRGWAGYSLAWVWTSDPGADTRFVGRQLLTGGISTGLRGFDVGFRLAYGSGLPFSEVGPGSGESPDDAPAGAGPDAPEGEEVPPPAVSGAPDDSYLRLDVEISRRWIARMGGSRMAIAPYLRILNALDRRDGLFFQAREDGPTRPAALASVPVLAVFGVAWSF